MNARRRCDIRIGDILSHCCVPIPAHEVLPSRRRVVARIPDADRIAVSADASRPTVVDMLRLEPGTSHADAVEPELAVSH
jgi:hypothetical protein